MGRTGSGKSTVARLIPRFYDVTDGRFVVDGHDVRDLTLASLRDNVGVVLDEPFLFSVSIRDNIAYGRPDADIADVEAAARAAGADEFIRELPEGYDTVVGERGYTLSGGQRQRIAIARTLLVNPPILVLDDATSAIDVQVEQQIHEALRVLMEGRTTLIVAHRLSTISLADRVVLLDGRAHRGRRHPRRAPRHHPALRRGPRPGGPRRGSRARGDRPRRLRARARERVRAWHEKRSGPGAATGRRATDGLRRMGRRAVPCSGAEGAPARPPHRGCPSGGSPPSFRRASTRSSPRSPTTASRTSISPSSKPPKSASA